MNKVLFSIGLFLAVFVVAEPSDAQVPDSFEKAWSEMIDLHHKLANEAQLVGSSVAFVFNGEVVANSFQGFAHSESQTVASDETIWHWASNTKMLTGMAIMQLRDRGMLDLDDPIIEFVPELKGVANPFGSMKSVTIRHLMSHSSGFRSITFPWPYLGVDEKESWMPHEPTSWDQLAAMIPYTILGFKPGSRFGYSNPGIVFLGQVIERLSGEDFEVYIDKNIFRPLEMSNSYFDHTPPHLLPQRAASYYVWNDSTWTDGKEFDTGITVSNGGWNAPIADIAKFIAFATGSDSQYAERFEGVLSTKTLREMMEPQIEANGLPPPINEVGLTFMLGENDGGLMVGHSGHQKAYGTFIWMEPDSKTGVIFALNTSSWFDSGSDADNDAVSSRDVENEIRSFALTRLFPLFRKK